MTIVLLWTKKSCWGADNVKKGTLYGILEQDCCGCPSVKCINCEPVEPKAEKCPSGEGARPLDCYDYEKHDHYASSEDKCWRARCVENTSDAPADKVCDARCQKDKTLTTHCLFTHNVCEANRMRSDCPKIDPNFGVTALQWPVECYKSPVLEDDNDGGHFWHADSTSCKKCEKWRYDKKSCDAKDAVAAAQDCHQFGNKELDKFCWKKEVTKDSCGCDVAECLERENITEEDEFDPNHVCPKDHVRMHGVSICLQKRDICKKCPPVINIDAADCRYGKVTQSKDCNGCPTIVCERARVPNSSCYCAKYKLTDGVLVCDCPEWIYD